MRAPPPPPLCSAGSVKGLPGRPNQAPHATDRRDRQSPEPSQVLLRGQAKELSGSLHPRNIPQQEASELIPVSSRATVLRAPGPRTGGWAHSLCRGQSAPLLLKRAKGEGSSARQPALPTGPGARPGGDRDRDRRARLGSAPSPTTWGPLRRPPPPSPLPTPPFLSSVPFTGDIITHLPHANPTTFRQRR